MSYNDFERESALEDKELVCVGCGNMFPFTGSEQKFFKDKGLTEPKRCKSCREKKKADRAAREANQNQNADQSGRERY